MLLWTVELPIFRVLAALFLLGSLVTPYIAGAPGAYVVIVLVALLSIWQYLRPVRVSSDPAAFLLLGAFGVLGVVFAIDGRPGGTEVLLAANFALLALYAPLSAALNRLAQLGNATIVALLSLIGTLIATFVASVQVVVYHMERAEGWGSNPIPSATVALFLGFVSLGGYMTMPGWQRNVFLLGPLLGIATVFLASSRGPLLAVPALVLTALCLARIRPRTIIIFALVGLAGAVFFFLVRPDTLERFLLLHDAANELATGAAVDADTSMSIRYAILQGSLAAFGQSPWLGYGWVNIVSAVQPYADVFAQLKLHLHSDILDFGVAGGVVGLLCYLAILAAPIVSALRSPRDGQFAFRRYAAVILSAGYFFCGAVNLLFGYEFMTTFYVGAAAIIAGYCRDEVAEVSTRRESPQA